MISNLIVAFALAGAAIARTPPGFEPASTQELTVAFGTTLAVNGVDLPKPLTSSAPTIGTAQRLFGSYTIMMVDPDIPLSASGAPSGQILHWMQGGLVSANVTRVVAGITIFELINVNNQTPFAQYFGPSPPARFPFSHRYISLLLNTTDNINAAVALTKFGEVRTNFSAANVVQQSGLTVVAGSSFNVTNSTTASNTTTGTGRVNGPAATSGSGATPTGSSIPTFTGGAEALGSGAFIAGLGALAAAMVIL